MLAAAAARVMRRLRTTSADLGDAIGGLVVGRRVDGLWERSVRLLGWRPWLLGWWAMAIRLESGGCFCLQVSGAHRQALVTRTARRTKRTDGLVLPTGGRRDDACRIGRDAQVVSSVSLVLSIIFCLMWESFVGAGIKVDAEQNPRNELKIHQPPE